MNAMKKITVVGAGISGLSSAYLLSSQYEVTLYEKNAYIGGHSRTLKIDVESQDILVDTGFIVFNYHTYPHLTKLFERLNVPVKKSDMSFGVSIDNAWLEYGSKNLNTLFAQRGNVLKPKFLRLIRDILKFNKVSKQHIANDSLDDSVSLGEYLTTLKVSQWFKDYYILAMGGAIWSTPLAQMYDFPAKTFIRFFQNHGLLETDAPVQWYTVDGGSQAYVMRLVQALKTQGVQFGSGVTEVKRDDKGVTVVSKSGEHRYDAVVFACHSNEALDLLETPTLLEMNALSAIQYKPNQVILHCDESFMPQRRKAWSSWVYLSERQHDDSDHVSLTYWMNNLQGLPTQVPILVTLNPSKMPAEDKIFNHHVFEHPQFDDKALKAQQQLQAMQGDNRTYFCGAYLRYGFHEDGIHSAVQVAEKLGCKTPW